MSLEILCSLRFRGECRMIKFGSTFSYKQLLDLIFGMWPDSNSQSSSFRYSVGRISNCVLDSDADVSNLLSFCEYSSEKFVSVDVYMSGGNAISPPMLEDSVCDTLVEVGFDNLGVASDVIPNISDDCIGSVINIGSVIKSNRLCQTTIPFKSAKKINNSGEQLDFGGMGSLPVYDICPVIPDEPLLSDGWGDIMKDGIGSVFTGGAEGFKMELIKHSNHLLFNFDFMRNDANYIYVKCCAANSSGCEWFIKARRQKNTIFFEIYKGHFSHNCLGSLKASQTKRLGPKIIGQLLKQQVRSDPNICGKKVVDILRINYGVHIPYHKGWRTSVEGLIQVYGSYDDSYDDLRWYCEAVKRTNPGSVADLEYDEATCKFERVFIAFDACIRGFRSCRPMLFIDGTFMRGRAKGTILTATAKDGNNGLFPVALAVVSAENTDNWTWFLSKISSTCTHASEVLYLSDRNCGLMSAFPIVFERPVHFFCLFHLLGNLRGRFGGGLKTAQRSFLADMFKECAYAPNVRIFDLKLAAFKEAGGKFAHDWLIDLPFEKWAVAFSPNITRYGEMTSNAAESFNNWMKKGRGLPITNMIDYFRSETSRWHFERHEASCKWDTLLCSSMDGRWKYECNKSRSWKVCQRTRFKFEVLSTPSATVTINNRSCSCSKWQICGFPCAHAAAVIRIHGPSLSHYVDDCFLTSVYRQCYMYYIHPIPDTERYETISLSPQFKILPPHLKRPPGRPKKKRLPSFGEYSNKKSKKL